MTPHLGRLSQSRFLDYLRARLPGPGLVITPAGSAVYGATAYPAGIGVLPDGYAADNDATLPAPPDAVAVAAWQPVAAFLGRQAEIVHGHGALLIGQIHHPGAERSWDSFQPSVAPSALDGEWPVQHPHELTDVEVGELIATYVAAAELIVAAGLDGVEVHAAHGYLLNRFLTPAYNHRTGRYGGSSEARWAVLTEILAGVRAAVGPEPILGVRLPAYEQVEGGLSVAEVAAGVARCAPWLGYVNLSLGNHDGLARGRPVLAYTTPWIAERPSLLEAAAEIRAAGVPVLLTGGITAAADVGAALAAGADLVGLARAAIADPQFAAKVLTGRGSDIVQCIGCNECTLVPFSCTVNPAAGREAELTRAPASRPRRVLVVGGGPAGLSAGLALHRRGHAVVLLERRDVLGGRLADLVRDPARARWATMLERLTREAHVALDVRLGSEFEKWDDYDAVVLATGADPLPAVAAADGSVLGLTSVDVLRGARPDGPVVVDGGTEPHLDPVLTALLLADGGRTVHLLTQLVTLAPAVEQRTLNRVLYLLAQAGVEVSTSTRVVDAADGAVSIESLLIGERGTHAAAAVVRAHGRRANSMLAERVRAAGRPTYVIGDALAPRRLTHAVLEGTRFGLSL
ncbi:MAG: hypothetical protein QOE97_1388 [Pseudonocardiales bacterium]|nr:hypothetical protein [Pseudonocardiales bacterium]